MEYSLAQTLMDQFAGATGLAGANPPRRYLWTDAFAVCNYLGLHRQTGDRRYLDLARELVDQVHHLLGRHRADDSRRGWISGLPDASGEQHPTQGGLRIGKPLNERLPGEPWDRDLEWDRDGQYFHYLTKWMHALDCFAAQTAEAHYKRWALELAIAAHRAFCRPTSRQGEKQIVWKMSIDLSRPLVNAVGQHDALDGLVTFLELSGNDSGDISDRDGLSDAIGDMQQMCVRNDWITDDPLGIGGLLDIASRLARLEVGLRDGHRQLLREVVQQAVICLESFSRSSALGRPADYRLPFRELGLSIGVRCLQQARDSLVADPMLDALFSRALACEHVAERIETFWASPRHRMAGTWKDHADINTVMLATSLAPGGYVGLPTTV